MPLEMIVPVVTPRMKEFYDGICLGINPRQVRAFVKITIDARKRQVIKIIAAAMYLGNDVLDVKNR